MPVESVHAANMLLRITERESQHGRSGIEQYGLGNGCIVREVELNFPDTVVSVGAGKSAGMALSAKPYIIREGVCFGIPVGSLAAWNALSSDDVRDNAVILDDIAFPVGSKVMSLDPQAVRTVPATAGGFAGVRAYGIPNATFPQNILVRVSTAGAAGTAAFQYSSDNGTTWSTANTSVASGVNTVRNSANADTGLRFRLATQTFALTDVCTVIVVDGPQTAKVYTKSSPEVWTPSF